MLSGEEGDQQLVERVQKGDKRAFDVLVLKYQHRIYSLVTRFVRDPDEVQDVVQEAFIKAYRNLNQYRGGSFKAWLLRIAKNLCIDHYRKNYARRREWEVPGGLDENQVASPADTADSSASDWREILSRGVGALAPQQKMVFICM